MLLIPYALTRPFLFGLDPGAGQETKQHASDQQPESAPGHPALVEGDAHERDGCSAREDPDLPLEERIVSPPPVQEHGRSALGLVEEAAHAGPALVRHAGLRIHPGGTLETGLEVEPVEFVQ